MKLYFKIRALPVKLNSCISPGRDNIPMINLKGELWFLWSKDLLKSDLPHMTREIYKLKKIGQNMKLIFTLGYYKARVYSTGTYVWYIQTKTGKYNIKFKKIG